MLSFFVNPSYINKKKFRIVNARIPKHAADSVIKNAEVECLYLEMRAICNLTFMLLVYWYHGDVQMKHIS